jgi:hypothetical protein
MKKGDYVYIALYQNTKMGDFVNIIEATEKAVKIKNDEFAYSLWIPKSAVELIPNRTDAYSIKKWFLKNITDKVWKRNIFGC